MLAAYLECWRRCIHRAVSRRRGRWNAPDRARVRDCANDCQSTPTWGRTSPSRQAAPARSLARSRAFLPHYAESFSLAGIAAAECRVAETAPLLDVHHLPLRSEGGRNQAKNVIALCGAHHRAAHRGKFVIEGATTTAAGFRHADGSALRSGGAPRELDARAKAFSGLRNLGFREGDVQAVLARPGEEGRSVRRRSSSGCARGWGGSRCGARGCDLRDGERALFDLLRAGSIDLHSGLGLTAPFVRTGARLGPPLPSGTQLHHTSAHP